MSKKQKLNELAGVDMRWVSPAVIEPHPLNPRVVVTEGPVWEAFLESVRSRGVLQPLLVRPRPDGEDGFECVGGHRRLQAALVAEVLRVPVIVRGFSDAEALEVLLIENLERSDLDPMEEAAGVSALVSEGGLSPDGLAARLGRSEEWVQLRLDLPSLPAEGHAAVRTGQLSLGVAREVLRLPADDRPRALQLVLTPEWSPEPLSLAAARRELEERVWEPRRLAEWWTGAMGGLREEWPMCDPIAPGDLGGAAGLYQYDWGALRAPWIRLDSRVPLCRSLPDGSSQRALPPADVLMEAMGFRGRTVPDLVATPMPGQERGVLPLVDAAALREACLAMVDEEPGSRPAWVDRVFSDWPVSGAPAGGEFADDGSDDDEAEDGEEVPVGGDEDEDEPRRPLNAWLQGGLWCMEDFMTEHPDLDLDGQRAAWVAWMREGAERLGWEGLEEPPPAPESAEG